eukprot:scaffold789_cov125-Isochrysis_galbana.AAC.13
MAKSRAGSTDLRGREDVWREELVHPVTLAVRHLAEVVLHHLLGLGQVQVPKQHLLVDPSRAHQSRIQLLGVVGGHDYLGTRGGGEDIVRVS